MDMEQLVVALDSPELNNTLRLLEDIVVDTDPRLSQRLSEIIRQPESIEGTHRFASLLEELRSDEYIKPLIEAVSKGVPGETAWLADYMYALGSILMERDEYWKPEEKFVHLLGKWLLTTGGGEISWKAGSILVHMDHPAAHQYFIKGAADKSLFHQTRIYCIGGIVNFIGDPKLIEPFLDDSDPHVKEAARNARNWLKEHEPQ